MSERRGDGETHAKLPLSRRVAGFFAQELARTGRADDRRPIAVQDCLGAVVARYPRVRFAAESFDEPILLHGNPSAIAVLFDSVIGYAHATASQVIIRIDRGTTALLAHVDDDGPGVPREERAKLLDASASLPLSAREGASQLRIQLAAAQKIAKAHGGEIVISSSPEGGARFSIRIPTISLPDSGEAA